MEENQRFANNLTEFTLAEFAGAASISLGLKDMVSSLMKINDEATKSAVILGKNAFGKPLRDNIKSLLSPIPLYRHH